MADAEAEAGRRPGRGLTGAMAEAEAGRRPGRGFTGPMARLDRAACLARRGGT
jgi:hypothetical protein